MNEDVGALLRRYRKLRGATLHAIAQKAGVSESFLSQLERGRTNASLATLRSVAGALDLELADLFASADDTRPVVSTPENRPTLAFGHRAVKQLLTPKPYRHMEVFVGEFGPGGTTGPEPLMHGQSEELLYVLEGSIFLDVGDERFSLHESHSVQYDSGTPHRVTELRGETAKVMWMISPPSL
ncbi:MAG: XRE family transcriptional regulator [Actinomycetota bacterium]|nr:XRE family transcriptional regulator [Actinomycetota bacterium]